MTNADEIARKLISGWMFRPHLFVKECVFANAPKGEGPSKQQVHGLKEVGKVAYAKYKASLIRKGDFSYGDKLSKDEKRYSRKRGIAIRSGHGCGKDAFLSWVYMWLLICFGTEKTRGQVTAPNQNQLRSILWVEFTYWIKYSKENSPDGISILSENLVVETEKVYVKGQDIKGERGIAFVEARTANVKTMDENEQGEALAGAHGDYMILAADEASGLPKGVFKPLEGAMTGAMNFAILIGNPTRSSGYFRECFYGDSGRWLCLHWNSEESEIVNQDEVEADLAKWGRNSNWYRIRRLGEFPLADPGALIPLDLIEAAVGRDITPDITDPVILGCDVSRSSSGDNSIVFARQGGLVSPAFDGQNQYRDSIETAGWINKIMDEKMAAVACVDVIGIGSGVVDQLRRNLKKTVMGVDARSKDVSDSKKFLNKRSELYWMLRQRFFDNTISIPDDDDLRGELSTIKVKPREADSKLQIESKEARKKRNLPSPDRADALMLTFAARDEAFRKGEKDPYGDVYDNRPAPGEDSWMAM